MKRIVAYGDSWTVGEGCNREIEDTLSKHEKIIYQKENSWVRHLSDKLGLPYQNNGISGNPNNVIFNQIVDDVKSGETTKNDLVVIMWSSSLRDYAAFLPRQQWVSWSIKHLISRPDKFINSYQSSNETYDSFLREYKNFFLENLFNQNYYNIVNQNYIIFLQRLLEFYDIKYFMVDAFDKMVNTSNMNKSDNYLDLINTKKYWEFHTSSMREYLEKTNTDCFEDTDEPGKHPNSFGYNLISQELYNYIVKNNII
jgi:lysophospholipase L1-like esterase